MPMHAFYDLVGRVALVTGGGGSIGGASARALAAAGADVIIVDIRPEAAETVAGQIRALGRKSLVLEGDAADYAVVGRLAARAMEVFGRVDILVNVAGGGQPKRFLELTETEFDRVLQHNLKSAWNWAHHLAPQMLTREGQRIINTASISAKHGGGPPATVSKSAYAAAKAGVIGLTKGLAKELAPRITVNAVCPGLIETPGTVSITRGAGIKAIVESIPMGRVGAADDVAAAVLFFASPGAGWITGESMDINGGQYID
jgi:3-oxoacyl-[acyl-carrier protein] reductase